MSVTPRGCSGVLAPQTTLSHRSEIALQRRERFAQLRSLHMLVITPDLACALRRRRTRCMELIVESLDGVGLPKGVAAIVGSYVA